MLASRRPALAQHDECDDTQDERTTRNTRYHRDACGFLGPFVDARKFGTGRTNAWGCRVAVLHAAASFSALCTIIASGDRFVTTAVLNSRDAFCFQIIRDLLQLRIVGVGHTNFRHAEQSVFIGIEKPECRLFHARGGLGTYAGCENREKR